MRKEKQEISISLNQHLTVSGIRQIVRLGDIDLLGGGDYHQALLIPATTVFVTKSPYSHGYELLNFLDQRLNDLMLAYDRDTSIEVVVIDQAIADKVRYVAGELIPQKTSIVPFSVFFSDLLNDHDLQKLTKTYLGLSKSKAGSKFSFKLKELIAVMGSNIPSLTTLNRLIKQRKSAHKVTPPSLKTTNYETPELVANTQLSREDALLKQRWHEHQNRHYSYEDVLKILEKSKPKYLFSFKDKVQSLTPNTDKFQEFVDNLEKYLNEQPQP